MFKFEIHRVRIPQSRVIPPLRPLRTLRENLFLAKIAENAKALLV